MEGDIRERERRRRRLPVPASRPNAGFRGTTHVEDSPEALRRTSLAVARAKQGDRDALHFLYAQYSGNVYGYVRSILRDDHDAEDVTQHVFAKLMTVLVKYDERGVPFFAWLLRLARNAAIDQLRLRRAVPVEEIFDPGATAAANLERPLIVRDALAELPEDQREVVLLRHLVGLSPGEIAKRMNRSEASIHGLQHRGRRTLQHTLTHMELGPATSRPRPDADLAA